MITMTIILALSLMGGGSFGLLDFIEEKEDQIAEIVLEEVRRENSLEIIETIKSKAKEFREVQTSTAEALQQGIENKASVEVVDDILADHFKKYSHYNSEMLDLRFELKAQITKEEWLAIFASHKQ